MDANGAHPTIRPAASAPDGEAAAIVAALERFLAETAPAADQAPPARPWQRAGLDEGIAARQVSGYVWGHAPRR